MTKIENIRFWNCKQCNDRKKGHVPVDVAIMGKQQITKCLGCGAVTRYTVRKSGGAGVSWKADDQTKKSILDRALLVEVDWEEGICTKVLQSDGKHYESE